MFSWMTLLLNLRKTLRGAAAPFRKTWTNQSTLARDYVRHLLAEAITHCFTHEPQPLQIQAKASANLDRQRQTYEFFYCPFVFGSHGFPCAPPSAYRWWGAKTVKLYRSFKIKKTESFSFMKPFKKYTDILGNTLVRSELDVDVLRWNSISFC